jgi:hypothetical protein
MGLPLWRLKEIFGEDFVPMTPEEAAQKNLDSQINEIMEVGLSDRELTELEKHEYATRLMGAAASALKYDLITPEDNYQLYMWVTGLLTI